MSQHHRDHHGAANTGNLSKSPEDEVCRRTLVIIPALNEAETLPGALSHLKCWPLTGVRVVDNGSSDETVELAANMGAEVIRERIRGYGSACWTGMQNLPESGNPWVIREPPLSTRHSPSG